MILRKLVYIAIFIPAALVCMLSCSTTKRLADDEVLYQQRRLLDKQGEPVDAATKVEAGQYSLEAAPDSSADGGDVTPVTPE